MVKIVALYQLVGEFRKRHATALQTVFDAVLSHHIVNGDMFSHITDKIQKSKLSKPIVIINHFGAVIAMVKIQELLQLLFLPFQIFCKLLLAQKFAFIAFTAWISNHSGGTTNQCNRLVACPLKMNKQCDRHEVAYVQGICGRIKTTVPRNLLTILQFLGAGHAIVQQATPTQLFNKIKFWGERHAAKLLNLTGIMPLGQF